jgi:hypothetical protein
MKRFLAQAMTKQELINHIRLHGYNIDDLSFVDGKELVGRECKDGVTVWNTIDVEGARFSYLFKRLIKNVVKNDHRLH